MKGISGLRYQHKLRSRSHKTARKKKKVKQQTSIQMVNSKQLLVACKHQFQDTNRLRQAK